MISFNISVGIEANGFVETNLRGKSIQVLVLIVVHVRMIRCPTNDLLGLQRSTIYIFDKKKRIKIDHSNSECHSIAYRPAAKSVPFALPNVLMVTLSGISHVSAPRIRLPNVTATASESIISSFDITVK